MKNEKKKDRLNIKFEDITLREIYAFMEGGNPDDAPKEIVEYLELMDKIRGMHLRIDRYGSQEAIIRHLITVEKIPRLKARRIYEETLEYFYCDSYVSKKAWRNIYAGMVDKAINFIFLTMKDPNDALKVVKAIMDAWKARGLDVEDKEELPEELFRAPIKIYTADAAALGMPTINRNTLKKQIEALPELTEKERSRILQEAGLDQFILFPDEQADPRKS